MTGMEIQLTQEERWWVARDEESGVTSQGETRDKALDNLDEAVALYRGRTGHTPSDEELRDLGVEPERNTSDGDVPAFLK